MTNWSLIYNYSNACLWIHDIYFFIAIFHNVLSCAGTIADIDDNRVIKINDCL